MQENQWDFDTFVNKSR